MKKLSFLLLAFLFIGVSNTTAQDAIKNEGEDSILHTVGELLSSHPSLNARIQAATDKANHRSQATEIEE